jgi:hypothetical protein
LQRVLEGLSLIEDGHEDVLNLSKKKKLTVQVEHRFSVNESRKERFEMTKKLAREIQRNPKKKRRGVRTCQPCEKLTEVPARRKDVAKNNIDGSPNKPVEKSSSIVTPQENMERSQKSKYLIKWALDCKDDPVIAKDPGLSPRIVYHPPAFPLPVLVTEWKTSKSTFKVTQDFVAKACVNFASLEVKGEEFLEKQKIEYENLNPETFAKVLIKRLTQ